MHHFLYSRCISIPLRYNLEECVKVAHNAVFEISIPLRYNLEREVRQKISHKQRL